MKTFRLIGTALMAVTLAFGMSACNDDDDFDPYADEPAVIEGRKDIMGGKLLFRLDANNLDQYHIPVSTLRNLDFEYQSDYYEFKQEVIGGTRYIIPVAKAVQPDYAHIVKLKASLKDEPERTRVVFLVFYKDDAGNTRSLSGLDADYSSVLGKGTNSFGKLGNTTQSVLLYDAIKHLPETHVTINPAYHEKVISLNCQDKQETFKNWTGELGVDLQKTFRKKNRVYDLSILDYKLVETKEIKSKLNGSVDLGVDVSIKEAVDYEFSLNIAKAHCSEISMDMERYEWGGNNAKVDTLLFSLVNPDFVDQLEVDSTKFDPVKFMDRWGTDVITRGAFGASWVYIYGRKQNIYETTQNYDAHVAVKVTKPKNVEIQNMAQFFAMKAAGVDGTDVDAKYSYMNENYDETTKAITAKMTYGGHVGKNEWSEFTNGIETNPALWTLMSYRLSGDTETEEDIDEGHKIYPIENMAYNLLVMYYQRTMNDTTLTDKGDHMKTFQHYLANVNAITNAKPDYIDKNSLVVEKRSDMFLVDVMMKSGKNGKQKGEPKPFCAKDYRGEWRMYYPMMANANSPVKEDIFYALETSQDEYNVGIDRSDHYWYYALASERDCNYGLVDVDFVHEKDIDTGYYKRGECARTDIGLSVEKRYVVVKPLDEGDSTAVANKKNTRLTSFAIRDKDTEKIIASTGGSELRANAYQSEITEFERFWTVDSNSTIEKDSIKLHDGKDHYFYKGGGIHHHKLQPVISRRKLHINRGTTDEVWHPKRWGE